MSLMVWGPVWVTPTEADALQSAWREIRTAEGDREREEEE